MERYDLHLRQPLEQRQMNRLRHVSSPYQSNTEPLHPLLPDLYGRKFANLRHTECPPADFRNFAVP